MGSEVQIRFKIIYYSYIYLTYLFARGPGGAETTLILSSVMSEPDALWGPPRKSLPDVRSDLNEFPRRSTPTGNEPALSMAVRGSTSLCSLPRCLPAMKIEKVVFRSLYSGYILQYKLSHFLTPWIF